MAKLQLHLSVILVYYAGVSYLEKSVYGGLKMEDDTVYALDKLSAQKLINKGVVTEVHEVPENIDIDIVPNVTIKEAPSILALSAGAHDVGAGAKEAPEAAYVEVTPEDANEPTVDGEGLELAGSDISVELQDSVKPKKRKTKAKTKVEDGL